MTTIRSVLIMERKRLMSQGCSRREAKKWCRLALKYSVWTSDGDGFKFTMPRAKVGGYDYEVVGC